MKTYKYKKVILLGVSCSLLSACGKNFQTIDGASITDVSQWGSGKNTVSLADAVQGSRVLPLLAVTPQSGNQRFSNGFGLSSHQFASQFNDRAAVMTSADVPAYSEVVGQAISQSSNSAAQSQSFTLPDCTCEKTVINVRAHLPEGLQEVMPICSFSGFANGNYPTDDITVWDCSNRLTTYGSEPPGRCTIVEQDNDVTGVLGRQHQQMSESCYHPAVGILGDSVLPVRAPTQAELDAYYGVYQQQTNSQGQTAPSENCQDLMNTYWALALVGAGNSHGSPELLMCANIRAADEHFGGREATDTSPAVLGCFEQLGGISHGCVR